jgi:antitoxin component YwqK of YwqJK toxin-antitoxin module
MKEKIFYLIFILFFSFNLYSQDIIDTIYYDKEWKGVSNKIFSDYYRIVIYPKDINYKKLFRDYFSSGELQGKGSFVSIDKLDDSKSIFDGECIQYSKAGKILSKKTIKNGKLEGECSEYYENGLIKSRGYFKDGLLSGIYTEFLENDVFMQAEYNLGIPKYDYYILSNKTGQIIKIKFSDNKPLWETPKVSERKIHYQNGVPWLYYEKNGLTIFQTNTTTKDYGKWHKINLLITNNSMVPIVFDPVKDIKAKSINKNKEITNLEVWSCDQYLKKVSNAQAWAALAVGMAEGMSTANAGYSTSTTYSNSTYNGNIYSNGNISTYGNGGYANTTYRGNSTYSGSSNTTSTTINYDASADYQTKVLSQQRMAEFSQAQWNEQNAKKMGYLKKNTINPGESVEGYVNIKRIKGNIVYITIIINGAEYLYEWTFNN